MTLQRGWSEEKLLNVKKDIYRKMEEMEVKPRIYCKQCFLSEYRSLKGNKYAPGAVELMHRYHRKCYLHCTLKGCALPYEAMKDKCFLPYLW